MLVDCEVMVDVVGEEVVEVELVDKGKVVDVVVV